MPGKKKAATRTSTPKRKGTSLKARKRKPIGSALLESAKAPQASKKTRFDGVLLRTKVNGGQSSKMFQPMDFIFRQGDAADAVHYVESGRIQLSLVSEHGKHDVIAMLGQGEFFGEGCLAAQPLRMVSASAMVPSMIVRIEKPAMIRALHDQPASADIFTEFLLSRNIQIEADLVDQLFNSSERRLARLLLLLANFGKDGDMHTIIPNVSQEALAARVGTTRSRVNFFMNKFRKLGLIKYNGSLKIHSALLNVIVHE